MPDVGDGGLSGGAFREVLFSKLGYVGVCSVAPLFVTFEFVHGLRCSALTPLRAVFVRVVPAATLFLVLTNEWLHLVWSASSRLRPGQAPKSSTATGRGSGFGSCMPGLQPLPPRQFWSNPPSRTGVSICVRRLSSWRAPPCPGFSAEPIPRAGLSLSGVRSFRRTSSPGSAPVSAPRHRFRSPDRPGGKNGRGSHRARCEGQNRGPESGSAKNPGPWDGGRPSRIAARRQRKHAVWISPVCASCRKVRNEEGEWQPSSGMSRNIPQPPSVMADAVTASASCTPRWRCASL